METRISDFVIFPSDNKQEIVVFLRFFVFFADDFDDQAQFDSVVAAAAFVWCRRRLPSDGRGTVALRGKFQLSSWLGRTKSKSFFLVSTVSEHASIKNRFAYFQFIFLWVTSTHFFRVDYFFFMRLSNYFHSSALSFM